MNILYNHKPVDIDGKSLVDHDYCTMVREIYSNIPPGTRVKIMYGPHRGRIGRGRNNGARFLVRFDNGTCVSVNRMAIWPLPT